MLRNFSASASIPWLRFWCSLFCSVSLFSASLCPTVASLVGFSCWPPSLVVPVCVCVGGGGFFLRQRSGVFFLSSCWVRGRLLLSLFWCGFCASSWGACGFPRRVLWLVTLVGSATCLAPVSWPTPAVDVCCWVGGVLVHHLVFYLVPEQLPLMLHTLSWFCTFLAPVCWPTPAVEPCCWVGGVFGASLGSLPCAVLFLRDLQFAQLTLQRVPLGFSDFSVIGCLSFCYPGGVVWAATLLFFFLCFSCSGWLAGVRWVLHPMSGYTSWGCVCSLSASVFTLLAFPSLRVGELLACGGYGVS